MNGLSAAMLKLTLLSFFRGQNLATSRLAFFGSLLLSRRDLDGRGEATFKLA